MTGGLNGGERLFPCRVRLHRYIGLERGTRRDLRIRLEERIRLNPMPECAGGALTATMFGHRAEPSGADVRPGPYAVRGKGESAGNQRTRRDRADDELFRAGISWESKTGA